MSFENLKHRTQAFAVAVVRFVVALPVGDPSRTLGRQLLRSATSVGANYRAACPARSTADFIAKLGIVEEEADESAYWLELMLDLGIGDPASARSLHAEADQLVAIVVSSIRTARRNAD